MEIVQSHEKIKKFYKICTQSRVYLCQDIGSFYEKEATSVSPILGFKFVFNRAG